VMTLLFYLGAAVCVYALVISFILIRKQQNKELDKGMNPTTVKHPIIANPMIIGYVITPILIIVGAMIWLFFTE
jgi:hypothetical protein